MRDRQDLQDWLGVVAKFGNLLCVCFSVGRWIAPAVVIEGEKVNAFVICAAVHVMSRFDTVVI